MTLVSNRYGVVRELGKGGFGTTSLVEDTQLPSGRRCVLKDLMPVENSPETYALVKQRFEREVVILMELLCADDPNIFVAGDLLWYPVEGIVDNARLRQGAIARADQAETRATLAEIQAKKLAVKLREPGIDPDLL